MPIFKVKAPDGSIIPVNAPEGATESQAIEFAAATWKPAPQAQSSILDKGIDLYKNAGKSALNSLGEVIDNSSAAAAGIGKGVGDVGLGIQKYAGKFANLVGADSVGNWLVNDAEQGKQKLTNELAQYKARNPIAAGGGELGGNVIATLPVGGVLSKVPQILSKVPALASQAPMLNAAATALRTSGFRTGLPVATNISGKAGQMALRSAAGASPAYASQALIDGNTDNAGMAAGIGAALPPGIKLAGELGKLTKQGMGAAVKHGLGASTGTGAESISAAYNAGKNKSTAFIDNMRGNVSFNDVVDEAKGALQNMRIDRANSYRSGMVDISKDKAVVDFVPISDAINKVSQMGSYKGQQINKNAAGTVNELTDTVNKWASLNPAEYHTPEGLDALKQAIGDIRDTTQFGTAARRSADTVYNAIKDQITAQAPTYSKVMKDYTEASQVLQETERALSLGDKASKDTAIRKLQSLMRNNAQTNYGNRLDIAKNLEQKGGASILPAIAGQSMTAMLPRGITGAIQKAGAVGGAVISPSSIPLMLAAAPFTSPRLVGESLYGLGRLNGSIESMANTAGLTQAQLASRYPGLLDATGALYRAAPSLAISRDR